MTTALEAEVKHLKEEVSELRSDIKGLVEAWNTAKGITTFVKWLASIAGACVLLWNIFHNGGSPKP